jgi:hypothetical protein
VAVSFPVRPLLRAGYALLTELLDVYGDLEV